MENISLVKSTLPDSYFEEKDQNILSVSISEIVKERNSNEQVNKVNNQVLSFSRIDLTGADSEYLSISADIHSILSNYPDLTNNQKLEYCISQRYFMKLYLKEVLIKIKNK
ncbi:MAG: hypothetical protein ACFFE4_23230 [Candidatus Thorarchaeota archaeon]